MNKLGSVMKQFWLTGVSRRDKTDVFGSVGVSRQLDSCLVLSLTVMVEVLGVHVFGFVSSKSSSAISIHPLVQMPASQCSELAQQDWPTCKQSVHVCVCVCQYV